MPSDVSSSIFASLADSDPSEWIMIQEEKEKHGGDMLR